jgi:hypothetical protein
MMPSEEPWPLSLARAENIKSKLGQSIFFHSFREGRKDFLSDVYIITG